MKYAIIQYKSIRRVNAEDMGTLEDAEARLPIVRQDNDVFYCTYPDGRVMALPLQQITAFYDSESDITLTRQQMQDMREREWL